MGKNEQVFWVILNMVVCCGIARGEQPIFRHYGTADGLSQSSVRTLLQDDRGYLWVGTAKGLNRFNGRDFEVFLPPLDSAENGLPHQFINDVVQDPDGMIWIATDGGLSKYDPAREVFTNFSLVHDCENCQSRNLVKTLEQDGDHLWIGTVNGLARINRKTHTLRSWHYSEKNSAGPRKTSIRDLETLDDGRVLIASQVGLSLYDPALDRFSHLDTGDGLPGKDVQKLFRDSRARYWLGHEQAGLTMVTGGWNSPTFRHYAPGVPNGPSHGYIYDMIEDNVGKLWLATYQGVTLFDPRDESFNYFFNDPQNDHSIAQDQIFDLYRDGNNRIWVGTIGGLNVCDPYFNQFEHLTHKPANANSLSANNTFSLLEDSRGTIWAGNYSDGLTLIQKQSGGEHYSRIGRSRSGTGLSGSQVIALAEDEFGRVWVGTFSGIDIIDHLDRVNPNYEIRPIPAGPASENKLPNPYIYTIKRDKLGRMWVGTHGGGVLAFDREMNVRQYTYDRNPSGLNQNIILNLTPDDRGRIWIAHKLFGISLIENPDTDQHFRKIPANELFQRKTINEIYFDGSGVYLTTDEGLYYFEDRESLLQQAHPPHARYTEADGLADNIVNHMLKAEDGTFWISTGNGLTHFDPSHKQFTVFSKAVGDGNFEFNKGAAVRTHEGTLYFGGVDGIIRFNPATASKNLVAPRLHLSNLEILNRSVTIPTSFREKIDLYPGDKVVSFALDAINFTLPESTQFKYKFEGLDEDWLLTKKDFVTRSNLAAGQYTLLAAASNNHGVWSAHAALEITMHPPWYQTGWAYLLFAALAFGAVYALVQLQLYQRRKVELARAEEREAFRKKSSRDFHDEAGTKITRIGLITELLKLQNTGNAPLQEYLHQISQNLEELNSGMRDFIWALDPSKDDVYETLSRFTEFAADLCDFGNVQFKAKRIPENLKSQALNMPERRHLLSILKEALNNSIKHGKPSSVNFEASANSGQLVIVLQDDGQGFDPKRQKNGKGLSNMQERSEILGAGFKIDSSPKKGTRLTLSLKTIPSNHAKPNNL